MSQHVCGAGGFNPMLGDSCPACDRYEKERRSQCQERIKAVLTTPAVLDAIARAANVCWPDVREYFETDRRRG